MDATGGKQGNLYNLNSMRKGNNWYWFAAGIGVGLLAGVLLMQLSAPRHTLQGQEEAVTEVNPDLSGQEDVDLSDIEPELSDREEIVPQEWAYTLQLIDGNLEATARQRDTLMQYMYEANDFELAQQLLQSYHQVDKLYQTMYLVRTNYAVAGIEQSITTFNGINKDIDKSIQFFKKKQQTFARIAAVVSILEQIIKIPILQVKTLPVPKPTA